MLRVLGPLEVIGESGRIGVGGPVARRVLCALAAGHGGSVTVDQLVLAAWGDDPPPSAERTLASHLTRIRDALRALDDAAVTIERSDVGVRLVCDGNEIDAVRFETMVAEAASLSPARAVDRLREALALWRPPAPYVDLLDTAYPAAQAARLDELRGAASERLVEMLLESGDDAGAAAEAEAQLTGSPYRERLWELLVVALFRQRRQAEALAAYARARRELREGLGIDPSPSLRDLEARVLAQDPSLLVATSTTRRPCPYKGLARYDESDAALFVGREPIVEELVSRLVDGHLLVLVGPSGAGKSSILRAGLVPALEAGALTGSEHWAVRVLVPGPDPVGALRDAVAGRPDVVVVDQAEEALIARDGGLIAAFGDEVLAAVAAGVRIVLAVRADFYGRLGEHAALARRAGPASVIVAPPGDDDLRRIVVEPAVRVGLRVSADLVDEVVAEVRGRPGVLPVLSTALVRTWEHRDDGVLTLASYRAGGGVEAALQRAGEEAWAVLDTPEERASCRRLLVRLATFEEGRWIRRVARRAELAPPGDDAASSVLSVLADRRLVVVRADDVEIAHEALLTGWPRLLGWLEESRSRADVLERLASAALAWRESGEDTTELYRGTRLQAALDTATANPQDLTLSERAFLDASTRESERELTEERARADREASGRRRVRAVAVGLALALVLAGIAGGYALHQQDVAEQEASTSTAAAAAADAGRVGALARSPAVPEDEALLLGVQAESILPGAAADSDLLAALSRSPALLATARAPSRVLSLAVAPDGKQVVSAGVEGQVIRWDAHSLHQVGAQTADSAFYVGTGPGGRLVVGRQGERGAFQVYDAEGALLVSVPLPDEQEVASDGRWAAFVSATQADGSDIVELRRIDAPTAVAASVIVRGGVTTLVGCGPTRFCLTTHDGQVETLSVPDGRLSGVDTRSGLSPAAASGADPGDLIASPDGREMALGANGNGLIEVRSLPSGRLLATLAVTPYQGGALAVSPDDRLLAGYSDGQLRVWDIASGQLVRTFSGHTGAITTAAWSPDSLRLYSAGLDRQLLEWDTGAGGALVSTTSIGQHDDVDTMWAAGQRVVVGVFDQGPGGGTSRLLFVDPATGSVVAGPRTGSGGVNTARTGGSGSLLIAADADGTDSVWDLAGRLRGRVELPPLRTSDAEAWVAPDGTTAATLRSADGPLYLIDLATLAVRHVPLSVQLPTGMVLDAVFGWTADGRSVLMRVQNPESGAVALLLVDPRTGQEQHLFDLPGNPYEVATDPHGRWGAAAGQDGKLRFFSLIDGHLLAPPQIAVDGLVYNVSVSPDGRYVATGGAPGQVRLWDTSSFREVGTALPGPVGDTTARVRFAPDGALVILYSPQQPSSAVPPDASHRFAGGDIEHGAVVWTIPVGRAAWTTAACREAGRALTRDEWDTFLPELPFAPAC